MKKIIIITLLAVLSINLFETNDFVEIPYSSIRIRIIADSNDSEKQHEKKIIKYFLKENLSNQLKNAKNYSDYKKIISDTKNINYEIAKILNEQNIHTSYQINYGKNYFPEKRFKGIKYPAGNYESLVVTLGEGKGENWWCVLYPPVCLIDEENSKENDYKLLVKEVIEEYKNKNN